MFRTFKIKYIDEPRSFIQFEAFTYIVKKKLYKKYIYLNFC